MNNFHFWRYMSRCFDSFLSVTGTQLRNDTRWCQCHMNFSLSINRISGDIIYFIDILIKLYSTINAHVFHVFRNMIMVSNRSTKGWWGCTKESTNMISTYFPCGRLKSERGFYLQETCCREDRLWTRSLTRSKWGARNEVFPLSLSNHESLHNMDRTELTWSQPSHLLPTMERGIFEGHEDGKQHKLLNYKVVNK